MSINYEERLQKRISFLGLLAMSIGINIGGSLFALSSVAAGITGPSLPFAMLLSSLPILLAIVPYGILASAWPTTSATYRYAQLVNPTLAFVCMLSLAICIVIGGQPLFALAFGIYLKDIVPLDPIVVGILVLTFFYVINLLGIDLTAKVQIVLFFMLILALLLYVILGVPNINANNLSNFFPHGVGGVFAAAGLLFTFCAGGLFVIDLGGEIIKAHRTLPRVLFIGILIALIFYVGIHFVTIGVIEWTELKGRSLIAVAETFMSKPVLVYFIIGGALVACATSINTIFSVVSRGLMVVSGEGLLPKFIGRVNARYGTPHWGLTIAYGICVISLIVIPSLLFFGSMLNLGLIFAITVVASSGLVIHKQYPMLYRESSIKVSPLILKSISFAIVIINSLIFIFFSIALQKGGKTRGASLLFLGVVVLVYIYALTRRRIFRSIKESTRRGEFTYEMAQKE